MNPGTVRGAKHGTVTGYSSHGCRCRRCTEARWRYDNERRAKRGKKPLPRPTNTVDKLTGLPLNASHQRAAYAALSGGWRETTEIAAAAGMTNEQASDALRKLRDRGMVEYLPAPAVGEPASWRRAAGGRVCAHRGCTTRLSAYNPMPWCALHAASHLTHRDYLEVVA